MTNDEKVRLVREAESRLIESGILEWDGYSHSDKTIGLNELQGGWYVGIRGHSEESLEEMEKVLTPAGFIRLGQSVMYVVEFRLDK